MTVEDSSIEVTHLSHDTDGKLDIHLESHAQNRVMTRVTFSGMTTSRAWFTSFMGTGEQELPLRDNAVTVTIDAGALTRIRIETGGI